MSVQSVLKGCHDALRESAKQHRQADDTAHAAMCDLQADAALLLMADVDFEHSPERKVYDND